MAIYLGKKDYLEIIYDVIYDYHFILNHLVYSLVTPMSTERAKNSIVFKKNMGLPIPGPLKPS